MSKKQMWEKLATPAPKRIKVVCPPHFTKNKTGDGWVIEGTDTPFDPSTYNEEDYTIYIDDWFEK